MKTNFGCETDFTAKTIVSPKIKNMDEMYRTVQTACKMAIRAHNREKKMHVIFKEVGLFRIKPVEEIKEIDQDAIYGWTVPKWYLDELHHAMTFQEAKRQYPMGNGCFVRKQFYKNDCYYNPRSYGIKLRKKYSQKEIEYCLINGQNL